MRHVLIILVIVATALTACGRRGPLEAPPGEQPRSNDGFVLDKLIK